MAAPLGILTLDTRFPRIYGDAGNPATWPFPVRIRAVSGATPERVVRDRADGLVDAFIDGAIALVNDGAIAVTTTCGFLSLHQRTIAERLPVPFASSSLLQLPALARLLWPRRAGIITIDRASLSSHHLTALDIDPQTPIEGVDTGGHLASVFLAESAALDIAAAGDELVAAARRLVARHRDIAAIVLECANMPPYARAVHVQLGIPVYDWYSMTLWLMQGAAPRRFVAPPVPAAP